MTLGVCLKDTDLLSGMDFACDKLSLIFQKKKKKLKKKLKII